MYSPYSYPLVQNATTYYPGYQHQYPQAWPTQVPSAFNQGDQFQVQTIYVPQNLAAQPQYAYVQPPQHYYYDQARYLQQLQQPDPETYYYCHPQVYYGRAAIEQADPSRLQTSPYQGHPVPQSEQSSPKKPENEVQMRIVTPQRVEEEHQTHLISHIETQNPLILSAEESSGSSRAGSVVVQPPAVVKVKKINLLILERNAIKNIANQLICFIESPDIKQIVLKLLEGTAQLKQMAYRKVVSHMKKYKKQIFTVDEMKTKFWLPLNERSPSKQSIYKVIRRLSKFFIEQILVQRILTSKQIKDKQIHLRLRQTLYQALLKIGQL